MVVLGIFIGVLGLTGINYTEDTIFSAYAYSVGAHTDYPDIVLDVDKLDPALKPLLAAVPGVQIVQYQTIFRTQWFVTRAPGHVDMAIDSFPDLQHTAFASFELTAGRYPDVGEIVLDASDQAVQHVSVGDTVSVNSPQGPVTLRVVGLARRPGTAQGDSNRGLGYMSDAGLEQLAQGADANNPSPIKRQLDHAIMVRISDSNQARLQAQALAQILQNHGVKVLDTTFPRLMTVPVDQIDGVFTLLRVLVTLAVLMTGLLIVNSVTTMVAEQTSIIGTMKAMGSTRPTIIRGYLATVTLYSLLASMPGLALGLAAGYWLSTYLASTIPLDLGPFTVSPWVVSLSLAVGFGVPWLAALLPLWNGTRISVREALSAYGVSGGREPTTESQRPLRAQSLSKFTFYFSRFTPSAAGRPSMSRRRTIVGQPLAPSPQPLGWLSQTTRMGFRGVFRKPWRLVLTLLTLTTAGTCFLVVQTATGSVDHTIGLVDGTTGADVNVRYGGNLSFEQLSATLEALPNVQRVERNERNHVTTQWGDMMLLGVDWNTQLYRYTLTSGRWLQAGDSNAVLLSDDAAAKTGLRIGDILTLQSPTGKTSSWTVIGTVKQPVDVLGWFGAAVTSADALYKFEGVPGAGSGPAPDVIVQAKDRSQSAVDDLARRIDTTLNGDTPAAGGPSQAVADIETWHDYMARRSQNWYVLYILLYGMALVVGAAGIVGIANALAASVLERRREIGMLRAMGASSWRVAQVFWVEGMALGAIAWACGALVGLPLAYAFVQLLSRIVLPVDFIIDPLAFLAMLAAVVGIVAAATIMPSLRASRVRVGEMLRYE
jgi:ABC-type antimicrobial peptide transport system permease subunit